MKKSSAVKKHSLVGYKKTISNQELHLVEKTHLISSNSLGSSNFKSFLNEIRKKAKTEREKGSLFERAMRDFLTKSPEYSFESVWLWANWPDLKKYGFPKKDLGIDLVAKEEETGKFWAIQCKCYD